MRFFDIIPFFRRRSGTHQSRSDISSHPAAAEVVTTMDPPGNTRTIRTETLNFDPAILYDASDRAYGAPAQATLIGYHDGLGYRPASDVHPIPTQGSRILYRAQVIRRVPNWHPYMNLISTGLLFLIDRNNDVFGMARQPNPPSTRTEMMFRLFDYVQRGNAALVFRALGTVNPFAKVFPIFPQEYVAFSFPQLMNENLPPAEVIFYQPPDPQTNITWANKRAVNVPAPQTYAKWWDTNTSSSSDPRDYHRLMKMLYATNVTPAGAGWNFGDFATPMAHDRTRRAINRWSMVYTGGHFKHYRLIVIPSGYARYNDLVAAYGLLYAGMGAGFVHEGATSELYDPLYTASDPTPIPITNYPIGAAWDFRFTNDRTPLRQNPRMFVIDFDQDDYRGVEYLSVGVGLIGFGSSLGRIHCPGGDIANPNPNLTQETLESPMWGGDPPAWFTNQTGDMTIPNHSGPGDEHPESCIPDNITETEEEQFTRLAVDTPWSNLDFELLSRRPDPGGSPINIVVRQNPLTSAYVYLIGLE